jgi:ribosomal protein L40E
LDFHPGRILGIILGLVILATIFFVPFGSTNTGTLYGIVGPKISNPGSFQSGPAADVTYWYLLIAAFILLVIAGVVGLFPLGTGVLGVVSMAMVTVAPYLAYPNGSPNIVGMGAGFYVIWIASIASLGASFWHRKKQPMAAPASVSATQAQTMGGTNETNEQKAETAPQVKCPNCGTMNPADAVQCSRCGYQFMKGT